MKPLAASENHAEKKKMPENGHKQIEVVRVSAGVGLHLVEGIGTLTGGNGLIVSILGGQTPHAGAVAIAVPRPSLKREEKLSVTSSVFTLVGHKDDEIARPIAEKLAKQLNQVTIVAAGVHIDAASKADIRKLVANSNRAAEKLISKVRNFPTAEQ